MLIEGRPSRTIWVEEDGRSVGIIDQTKLPHAVRDAARCDAGGDAAHAIRVDAGARRAADRRGRAPMGMCLALADDASDAALERAYARCSRDAADRHQPAMGARPDARPRLRNRPRGERVAGGLRRGRGDLRRGCRDLPRPSASTASR